MRIQVATAGLTLAVAFLLATNPIVVDAAGQITGAQIKNGSVAGKDIKDRSLKGNDVADGGLGGADVADGSLGGADVADGSLGGADVVDGSISGADIDESTLSIPAASGTRTYSGVSFHPRDAATTRSYQPGGGVSAAGGTTYFTLRLDLPQDATITKVTFQSQDNGAEGNTAVLTRYTPASAAMTDLAWASTSGASPGVRATVLTMNVTVDNRVNSYNLLFSHGAAGPTYVLYGATVEYTFTPVMGITQRPPLGRSSDTQ